MKPSKRYVSLVIAVSCALLSATLIMMALGAASSAAEADTRIASVQAVPSPERANQAVQRAWRRAQELGVYHFATSLVEKRYPAPSLINVGSGPQQQEAWLEGDVNLPAHSLTMRLWQGGGSVANPADAAEIRIEGEKVYTRRPGAEVWQPVDDADSNFAADANLLSYLAGIKNVTLLGAEVRDLPGSAEIRYTRYGFEMDGPALAAYMRDRLQQVLMEQGKLPPGMTVEAPRDYRELTGQGEVWLDERGLPLRLKLHLVYPPAANGAYSEAVVQSDFSGFPRPEAAALPASPKEAAAWAGAALDPTGRHAEGWQAAGRSGLALAITLGLTALVVVCRRSRRIYVATAVAVILAMTVVPLLQNSRVAAFMEEQAANQAKAAETLRGEQAAAELAAERASWDPTRDPLSMSPAPQGQPEPGINLTALAATESGDPCTEKSKTADADNDGLTDYDECSYGLDPEEPDWDGDLLNDGQEVNYLGASPFMVDSDGDMITDTLEVQGFIYPAGGQHWYLDPRNPDTNGDGWGDGLECPALWRGDASEAAIAAECDTDGDRIPNLFESDNDNDGVPDKVDLSPNQILDLSGIHSDASRITPFTRDQPFLIRVQDLQPDWPAFLDIQLRPEDPKHLTYALNVLDWPAADTDGQIQHAKNKTFATSDNPDIAQPNDEAGAYGDMRLIPLLEIEMSGSSLPLMLTTPAVTAHVASGSSVLSTTVRFEQDSADTSKTTLTFTFGQAGTYGATIYDKPCSEDGAELWSAGSITDGQVISRVGATDDGWLNDVADGRHALEISNGATSACANIPNIINGPYANKMVDQSVLAPYGIGLVETGSDPDKAVAAYVPLSAVSDDTTGGRAAFSARMLYWPGEDNLWDQAQKLRVVWAVQALLDACKSDEIPWRSLEEYQDAGHPKAKQADFDEAQRGWCLEEDHRTPDAIQIVQTYDESFHITGLAVREDHGLDVAVAYPDPSKDYDENPLWQLSWGLGHSFINGQDCENDDTIVHDSNPGACHNDGVRDLTIYEYDKAGVRIGNSTIFERFGSSDPSWTGSPALWEIEQGALLVENMRYDTQDHLAKVAMEVTPAILEQFDEETGVTPSLLFTREEHYRSAGLEAGDQAGGILILSVGAAYLEQTLAAMSWAPFRYNPDPGPGGQPIGWESYPMSEYYDTLDARLKGYFINQFPDDDADTIAGRAMVAQGYYVSLFNGIAGLVQPCPEGEEGESCPGNEESKTAEELAEAAEKVGDVLVDISFEVAEEMLEWINEFLPKNDMPRGGGVTLFFMSLGHGLKEFGASPWKSLFKVAPGAALWFGGLLAGAVILTIALSWALGDSVSGAQLVQRILLDVGFALNVMVAVKAVHTYVKAAKGVVLTEAELIHGAEGAAKHTEGGITKGGVIRLVIQLALLWAAFIAAFEIGGIARGTMVWDDMLASTIAWTITSTLMYLILAVVPFGELIGAVIAAIDALVRLICNSFLSEEQREGRAGQWLCGGISGIIKNIFKRWIYSGAIIVEMDPEHYDRLTLGNFDASNLTYPERGVTYGNSVKYSIALTNTLDLADYHFSLVSLSAPELYTIDNLRKSNFIYKWQDEETDIHEGLSLGGMAAPGWKSASGEHGLLEYHTTIASEEAFPLPEVGIDRPMGNLYLSEGYRAPEAQCWGVLWFADCRLESVKGTAHYPFGDTVKYDVLPTSLDGFYALEPDSGGQKLAWDPLFPRLHDADGDGLPYSADSDDANWDADGDGLSDGYEVETGSDPMRVDTDHDGLTDHQEARLWTDPAQTDTDGDGLYDCQEAFHQVISPDQLGSLPGSVCGEAGSWSGGWEFVYGTANGKPLITRVSSDPTDPDEDADNYLDSREKVYGFNPRVPSQSNILTLDTQLYEISPTYAPTDGYVGQGSRLDYTATITNELDAREAQGLLWTESAPIFAQGIEPQSFVLMPKEQKTVSGYFVVAPDAASGTYSFTQAAGALITDWSELSGDADLWLRFDDAVGATTYADTSGSIPPNDAHCGGPLGACSIVEAGGKYGSSLQLSGAGYVEAPLDVSESAYGLALWFKTSCANCGIFSVDQGVLGAGGHDRHLYLNWGNVCARVYSGETVCTSGRNFADGQWHQVVHTFGGNVDGQVIYVDGQLRARGTKAYSDFTWQDGINIGFSNDAGQHYFTGQIDDVRLFPAALTPARVRELFNQPIFHMNFEQHTVSGWKDVGGFHTPLAPAASPNTPSPTSLGATGWGAEFDGADSVKAGDDSVERSGQLDLSDGKFTLSAWLRPKPGCPAQSQNILGMGYGEPGYWSLILFRGASGPVSLGLQMKDAGDTTDAEYYAMVYPGLVDNVWNHLVVTYDKDAAQYGLVTFYLNGELISQQPFSYGGYYPVDHPHPAPGRHFYIGSAGAAAFCGTMDEVEIFNYVLPDAAVKDLLLDSATALRLPLDEPPGVSAFGDASNMQRAVACSGSNCPTTGVAGRVNQAARFNIAPGHWNDHLTLSNSEINGFTDRLTVAAWIKLDQLREQYIVSTANTKTRGDGWGFGADGSELRFFTGWNYYASVGANLQPGRWYHVAAVFDSLTSKTLQFYLDGKPLGAAISGVNAGPPDTADVLLIGATTVDFSTTLHNLWYGAMDDLTILSAALTPAQMDRLFHTAADLHLRFDDAQGATTFANNANPGLPGACAAGAACPLVGEGARGQIGLAAQFDGQDDVVTLPNFGAFSQTTASAWVKRTGAANERETILSYKEAQDCGFVLGLNQDGSNQHPRFWVKVQPSSGLSEWRYAESTTSVGADSWHYLAGTYDGETIRLYQNGNQVASAAAPGAMVQCNGSTSVGARASNDRHYFPGLIDEVQVFDHALTAEAIHNTFVYQNGWVEDRPGGTLTVDADPPTVEVVVPDPPYQANWPAQVKVNAADVGSGVEKVWLRVGGGAWSPAPHCVDPVGSSWCPTFSPTGQGIYSLQASASDGVQLSGISAPRSVYVDDSAPTVSLAAPPNGAWYTATEYEGKSNTWTVHFSGNVSDPALSDSVPGSGVPADGVQVTLYRADGGLVGAGPQTATVSAGAWSLDYLFGDADPSGCYRAVVEAVDRVARTSGLPDAQVARHTTIVEQQISVDGDAAYASVDWTDLSGGQLGPAATALGGAASSRPVPVVLDFTGGGNSDQTELVLTCQHGNEGSWWQPYSTTGATLTPGQSYTWGQEGKPTIHRGSSCQVQLATSAAIDDLSGTVTVCGEKVLEWSGVFSAPGETLSFIADSPGCSGGAGCPVGTQKATAGVHQVDVSFLPVTPGSPFYNETPPEGEALHLTMDTGLEDSGAPTFPDVSPNRLTGTCSGAGCPVAGQQGHSGSAAFFDGVDDYVDVPLNVSEAAYGVALWFKTTCANCGIFSVDKGLRSAEGYDRYINLSNGNVCATVFSYRGVETKCTSGANYADGKWHHVVHTHGGAVGGQQLWVDGVRRISGVITASDFTVQDGINIGFSYGAGRPYFAGLIDEVRVFDRALTEGEIKSLFVGSGPTLALPFEKQWAADGSELEDVSGWQQSAVLHTGSGDAAGKAATGQVGRYALQFDGVDDYAVVPDHDAIDFDANHDFAVSAWIKPDATQPTATNTDSDIIEKWTGPGGYPYVIRYLNQREGAAEGKIVVARYDGVNNPLIRSTRLVNDGRFHHVAFVKEGGALKLYIDGMPDGTTPDTTSGNTTNSSALFIGQRGNGINRFAGAVDDVRIYPRALSAPEVQALFLSGWQPATVAQSGPTVEATSWEIPTPAWLEGSYRIEARGWDSDGHTSPPRSPVQTWSGEADTLAPRVTLVRTPNGAGYRYTTTAEDYNLTAAGLLTPCPSGTITVTTNFQSPWYVAVHPATQRLYRLVQDCTLTSQAANETATACDAFGNCATAGATLSTSTAELPADVQAALARTAEEPVSAPDGASGAEVSREARAESQLDAASGVVGKPAPMRPALDFVPTVLTTTHLYPPSVVKVTGLLTGTQVLRDVTVRVGDSSGQATLTAPTDQKAMTTTWSFPWTLARGALPDGVMYTAVATATRAAGGRPVVKTAQLMVDVAPPGPVALTLQGDGQLLGPGDAVRTASPELVLSWPAANDGSGVAGYVARWTVQSSASTTQSVRTIGPGGPLEDRYTAGEAQRLTVDLASRDLYGNLRWQELGPVYADGPLTPDYIALGQEPYEGWQESGCTFLGADRRPALRAPGRQQPQRLYATWDQAALRLAWTGASWSSDGDLFVYLDTGPGGASSLYNPTAPSPEGLQLSNEALQADYVVWVEDAHTATLLHWNGNSWDTAAALSEEQYGFDPGREGGQTDLYLPFELINLTPASSLGLLAVAAGEPEAGEALQLWATLPQFNPVNSALVNRMLAFMPAGAKLTLKHAYRWPALSDGVCPNGSDGNQPMARFGDVQPQLSIESDPSGVGLSGLGRGLFWVTEPMLASAGETIRPGLEFVRPAHPPVEVGQTIHYTVRYRNAGTETQHGVRLVLTGYGIDLSSSAVMLGDVEPGAEALATFEGQATGAGPRGAWAAVHGLLYDASHPDGDALEWLWAAHRVDQDPPDAVSITSLRETIGPNKAALGGSAFDESGVASVEFEIAGPSGLATFTCSLTRPGEGYWQCPWNIGGAPDGAQFVVRARATDLLGHTGEWSSPRMVRVDARPPELQVTSPLTATVIRGGASIFGAALDDSGISGVQVCIEDRCERASLLAAEGGSARWKYRLPSDAADYVSKIVSVYGTDRLGNRTEALQATVTLDNVPPTLSATQVRDQVVLGDRQVVLEGTVQDGGPGSRVFVRVQGPDGAQSWKNTAREGDAWRYELPGEMPGRYMLWLQAVDGTGNTRTMGPYAVDVTCTDAVLITRLTAELEATGSVFTVTAVISNTGPALLPAGAEVTIYAGEAVLQGPQPLPAMEAGQASTVSAQWAPPEPTGYELSAVINGPPDEVLCATPSGAKIWIGPDVDLRISKTVTPTIAKPGDVITYTLVYSNSGSALATGVVINDPLPIEILAPTYHASGAVITQTVGSGNFAWEVADLDAGQGGEIVINGIIDPAITSPITITNVVTLTSPLETAPEDNEARVQLPILLETEPPIPRLWLPWILR